MTPTHQILKLFLFLLLELLQLPEFLLSKIMFVVETLILVVAVDHLRSPGGHVKKLFFFVADVAASKLECFSVARFFKLVGFLVIVG
jgi:hypothetical protein